MYNAALRSAPNDVGILLSRCVAHSMSTPPKLDLALKDAETVIQLKPDWWHGWLQKGDILSQMDDLDGAEEALTIAIGFAQGVDKSFAHRTLANVQAHQARSPPTSPTESELPRQSQLPSTARSPMSTPPYLPEIPSLSPLLSLAEIRQSPSASYTSPPTSISRATSTMSTRQTGSRAKDFTLPGPSIMSRLGQGSASVSSTNGSNQSRRFSRAQSVSLGSGSTTMARESIVSTSNVNSSTRVPASASRARRISK